MQGKKSFVLYADIIFTIQKLSDEKAGQLFKIILKYVNDENPTIEDPILDLVFEPIKQSLKRDLDKWRLFIEKQRLNGQLGGRPPKNPEEPKKAKPLEENPKKPMSVSVSVIDNDSVNVNEIINTPPTPSRGEIVLLPDLEIQIAEYKEKNRLKYTDELYTQFLEYWGAPVISGRGIGKKLWQVQKAWSLSGRLATWNSRNNTQTKKNGTETAAEEAKRLIREGNR